MTKRKYIHEDCEACVQTAEIQLVMTERYRQIVDAYIHDYYQNKENDGPAESGSIQHAG